MKALPTPVQSILEFILYSNIFIAGCAGAMALESQWILFQNLDISSPLLILIVFSTFSLYSLHRWISMKKLSGATLNARYESLARLKNALLVFTFIGTTVATICFFYLQKFTQWALLIPGLLSMGYAIPIWKGKRLRDFSYLKAPMVAVVWSWVTVVLPHFEGSAGFSPEMGFLFWERTCFILAITIPFDIRDIQLDKHLSVGTFPTLLGIPGSRRLAWLLLLIAAFTDCYSYQHHFITTHIFTGLILSYSFTAFLIGFAGKVKHDFYYSLLIDGQMILQFCLIMLPLS